jgi:hypothetical protein
VRIWSLHPRYLDARGLVALWREALLAQAVLRGATRGYTQHPQLNRFRETQASSVGCIADYLRAVNDEAKARGYRFDAGKISRSRAAARLLVTTGQLEFEWAHLLEKLRKRAPVDYRHVRAIADPDPHPLFRVVPGPVADWERGS